MKMTHLFAGVAAVALTAGAASAQSIVTNTDGASSAIFASEVDLSAAAYQDILAVAFTNDGDEETALNSLGATDDVNVTLTLSGGLTFSSFLSNANVTNTDGTDAGDCSLSISSGGSNGGQTVTFTSVGNASFDPTSCDFAGAASSNLFAFSIPVDIEGTGNIAVEISLASTGTVLDSQAYDAGTGTDEFVQQDDGVVFAFVASDSVIDLDSDYELFDTASSTTTIGSIEIDEASVLFSVGTGGADDEVLDFTDATQFDGGTVTVTLPNPAGIASVTVDGIASDSFTGGVATFNLSNAELDGLNSAGPVVLTADTTTPAAIANQTVTATASADAAAGGDMSSSSDNDDLGTLTREGSNTGTFEWVGDSTKATRTIFRAVGLGATLPTIRVTIANSTNDMDGEYIVTPTNSVVNGELVMSQNDITNAVGNFGRADVSWSFEADGITVRRFNATNGVISEMSTDYAVGADEIGG
ncbi:hypothetical protein [Maricaulis sp. CAU 1757]